MNLKYGKKNIYKNNNLFLYFLIINFILKFIGKYLFKKSIKNK